MVAAPIRGGVKNETLRNEGMIVHLLGLALLCTMAFARQVVIDVSFLAVVKNRCLPPPSLLQRGKKTFTSFSQGFDAMVSEECLSS